MTTVLISRGDGLGTRIINLVNGIYFSKKQNLNYKINWDINDSKCNLDLKNIFTNIKYKKFGFYIKKGVSFNLNHKKIKKKFGNFILFRYIEKDYFKDKKINLKELNNKHILFNAHHNYIDKKVFYNIFSKFKINNNILRFVKIFNYFELDKITGVHVRRGDLVNNCFKNNRDRCINIDKYFKYLDKNNIKKIFLCSDDINIYSNFSKKYEVIRYYHRELTRNSEIGIEDSLIDILLLSKCKEIVSGKSNFSLCASCIGNKKLIILKK